MTNDAGSPIDSRDRQPALSEQERESLFHDEWARQESPSHVLVNESFESCTSPENRKIVQWLGEVRGLSLLEIGCGCGEASVYFAKKGAIVTATDLSPGMLDLTRRVAVYHGTSLETQIASSDRLPFEDGSFDIVYGANVLHHSNLELALGEAERVLKPGGRACFWDPIAHNPAINVYRRMASKVRTPDEHPLRIKDLELFRQRFATVEVSFHWLTTLLIFLRFYFIEKVHPNQERYWKKIIREADRLRPTYNRLSAVDKFLLGSVPWLGRFCWNVVVCVRKGGS